MDSDPAPQPPADPALRALAAGEVGASPALLAVLARDLVPRVRYAAVLHPALPPRAMLDTARTGDASTCEILGSNPEVPAAVIRLLASHVAAEVRTAVARHPRMDLTTLERLTADASALVRSVATAALERRLAGTVTA
ncbi:hypothetical protein QQX09_01050 [Demequina sp. SYSU T00192]|uniref:Leucine rich repeat variant n=1 Tax=Demequina litoralis TaxID=3051660 RepID=A0ABT8G5N3_9MICO|nr:hypothetical protein [Demequina sp. SYSU T00192]MDN4474436.1 hypothetical protein [Demequina sp. SYSU T00192]